MKVLIYSLLMLSLPSLSVAAIHTNQEMIESLATHNQLDNSDTDAVLSTVLDNIPNDMTVYPTEGYYYFWFYHQGNLIRGNLRFGHNLIDKGKVSFAYYYDIEGKSSEGSETYQKTYSRIDGLRLERIAPRQYMLEFQGRKKHISLNIPSSDYQHAIDETLLGQMQDESGVIFSFVFNHELKQFYYLLDETQHYEYYYDLSPNVSVGARTGFVYFDDNSRVQPRKILIGVRMMNATLNNFYDGPFDQLPDYNLGKTAFEDYVGQAYPYLKDKVDSHGHFLVGEDRRVAINNYVHYADLEVFKYLEQCHEHSLSCVQNFINLSKR